MDDDKKHDTHQRKGRLIVISAPSGAGKSTLCKALLQQFPDIRYSISHTCRKPRAGEKEGIDYHFVEKDVFEEGIRSNLWAEWAEVHDNYYGTSAASLDRMLNQGSDVLLDIDVQGAAQIIKRYPDSMTIFILPPSINVLKDRLLARKTDDQAAIETRLRNAEKEIAARNTFQHIIINDRLDDAIKELFFIVRQSRQNSGNHEN